MNPVPLATDWEKCKRIAGHFRYQVHPEDGDDLVQDVLLEILERARRNGGLSDKELWRAARCVRNRYWRAYKRDQRLVSLNTRINDGDGGTELWELISDSSLPDVASWLDARLQLSRCPPRVLAIAAKRASGLPLTRPERKCLQRFSIRKLERTPRRLVPILAERVKELREGLGWNRCELARRSHLPRSTIVSYEIGQARLAGRDHLERLAQALGVSTDYLASADDPNSFGKTIDSARRA